MMSSNKKKICEKLCIHFPTKTITGFSGFFGYPIIHTLIIVWNINMITVWTFVTFSTLIFHIFVLFYTLQIGILWLPMLKSRRIPSSFVTMVSVSSPGFRGRKLCRSPVCVSSSIVHLPVPTQFYKSRRLCRGQKKNRLKSCTVEKMVRVICCRND